MLAKVHVGDILVAINEFVTLEEDPDVIQSILNTFQYVIDTFANCSFVELFLFFLFMNMYRVTKQSAFLQFIVPSLCSCQDYRQFKDDEEILQRDALGFPLSRAEHMKLVEEQGRRREMEWQLEQDWQVYLAKIGGIAMMDTDKTQLHQSSARVELRALVRRGIPHRFRARIWSRLSGSDQERTAFPSNYYQLLLSKIDMLSEEVKCDIEKDLDRTFPTHDYFDETQHGQQVLFRILSCYAVHNPAIGYCQSMNYLAAFSLLVMKTGHSRESNTVTSTDQDKCHNVDEALSNFEVEEYAFFLLLTILDQLLPSQYFTQSMLGAHIDQRVFLSLVEERLSRVFVSLSQHEVSLSLLTASWFLSLFLDCLSPSLALRVWDVFLCDGDISLFAVALALLRLHEKTLCSQEGTDLFGFIRDLGSHVYDVDELFEWAFGSCVYATDNTDDDTVRESESDRFTESTQNSELDNFRDSTTSEKGQRSSRLDALKGVSKSMGLAVIGQFVVQQKKDLTSSMKSMLNRKGVDGINKGSLSIREDQDRQREIQMDRERHQERNSAKRGFLLSTEALRLRRNAAAVEVAEEFQEMMRRRRERDASCTMVVKQMEEKRQLKAVPHSQNALVSTDNDDNDHHAWPTSEAIVVESLESLV
jgi:hypothetical protein